MVSSYNLLDNQYKGKYYMVCLWPVADFSKLIEVEAELQKCGEITHIQDVNLNYLGMKNFMIQIYGHQAWTGSVENHFRGIRGKVDVCYRDGQSVRTYLLKADCLDEVLAVKKKIREIFKIEKSSMHTTDNQSETERMVELLYYKNSVDFMNFAKPYRYSQLYNKLVEVKKYLQDQGLDKNRFIIGGDAIFELCGLRKAKHYEIMTDYEENEVWGLERIIDIEEDTKKYGCIISDLLYNPHYFFYFEEMKFVTIQCVREQNRLMQNDRKVRLSDKFINRMNTPVYEYPNKKIVKYNQMRTRWIEKVRHCFSVDENRREV